MLFGILTTAMQISAKLSEFVYDGFVIFAMFATDFVKVYQLWIKSYKRLNLKL